ncbi:hypothetical protein G7Y89_g147 [Cudoniella acicularis]|uniref:Carbonic anhydrase n=1 Tax=Cudoniella acicularis TaxID=354080 RepID=A0A8H4RXP8_9HELO|nr:hypothetical protein G7Y89_g147 [Cudoniella acicularis]
MATLTVDEFVNRNKAVAATHQPSPTFAEMGQMGVDVPHVIVLTCIDPRCKPEYFLNLQSGDGVLVMRNICGHVNPALNDILALDSFLTIKDILIIHHTDCGASHFTDAGIREDLKKRLPGHAELDTMGFGAINDLEQSVKDELKILRASPLVRRELAERAAGFVFDIKTGELTPVGCEINRNRFTQPSNMT